MLYCFSISIYTQAFFFFALNLSSSGTAILVQNKVMNREQKRVGLWLLLFFQCFIISCRKFGIAHYGCTYILRESVMKVDWGGWGGVENPLPCQGPESFAMPGNQTWFSIVPGFLVLCSTELTCPISSFGILLFGFILFPLILACSWHQSAIDSFGLLGRKWQCS